MSLELKKLFASKPKGRIWAFIKHLNSLARPASPASQLFWLVVLAAAIRLTLLPKAFYGSIGEMYRDLEVVWKLYHNNVWPLLGPSSALGGFYFGAIYYYIEAVFIGLFRFVPIGAIFTSTVFSLLSLPMLYKLCRSWFQDSTVAVLAVAIQAVALFDVQNAYYVSNPNLLPFFLLAFFWVLTRIIQGDVRIRNYVILGLLFGTASQLHTTALVLMTLVMFAAAIKFRIRPSWKQVSVFLLVCGILYLPYGIFEIRYNFALSRTLIQIGQHQAAAGSRLHVFLGFLNFFGSLLIFKDGFFSYFPDHASWFFVAVTLAALFVLFALWLIVGKKIRPQTSDISAAGKFLLAAWLGAGLLMYLASAVPPAFYYFLAMWPAPAILLAWWLAAVRSRSKIFFALAFGGYVLLQGVNLGVFFYHVYQPQFSHSALQQAFAYIKQQSKNGPDLVLNQALDVNQFYYYLRFNGLNSFKERTGGQTVYVLRECTSGAEDLFLRARVSSENFHGLCVDEFKK